MLELDVLLLPFVEKHFEELTVAQQDALEQLLTQDDPELFAWFMGHQACPEPELAGMVSLILERNSL
jgi:antitoxin CptB